MENKHNIIISDAVNSLSHFIKFSKFVANSENLLHGYGITLAYEQGEIYDRLWFELEIVNALALSEWEEQGSPSQWNHVWESKYKAMARVLIDELIEMFDVFNLTVDK